VIALVGDGAMQMNNMAELITVAKYWSRWPDPRWIVCVFNNQDLNQVTWEQRVMEGDPKYNASQNIPDVPYHRFAELIGLRGIFVDRADEVGPAWDEALACDRPVVLEFKTDPEVPPLPPHITFKQARHFAHSMAKDPHGRSALRGTARQLLNKLFAGWRKNGEDRFNVLDVLDLPGGVACNDEEVGRLADGDRADGAFLTEEGRTVLSGNVDGFHRRKTGLHEQLEITLITQAG
jgi:Thiamine pyrophosphate enzyme, C-terminal TPP binding domain